VGVTDVSGAAAGETEPQDVQAKRKDQKTAMSRAIATFVAGFRC
jgi:hypothetical protein